MKKFSRFGEMTTQQIVMLVILIVSFIVILLFIFYSDLGGETTKDACHNSVLLRAGVAGEYDLSSLECKREYLCLTQDGSCEGLTNPEVKKVRSVNDVYKVLADSSAECWWMFGEGKINYVGEDLTHNNYCSICDQVYFDDSLKNIPGLDGGEIDKNSLYRYMSENKLPDKKITYSQYLYGVDSLGELKELSDEQLDIDGNFGKIDLSKQYFILTGITSETEFAKWAVVKLGANVVLATVGLVAAGFFAVATPPGWIVSGIIVVGGLVDGVVANTISSVIEPEIAGIQVEGKGVDNKFLAPTIIEVNSEKYELLNCEDILTQS